MNRVKLIPSNKTTIKPNRYSLYQDNSSGLTLGPSPGKEVHETIESPEQFTRIRDEEPGLRGKSPPLKQFYPRYLQKSNKSTQFFTAIQNILTARVRDAFESLKIQRTNQGNFL
jgi:hypothetical protein